MTIQYIHSFLKTLRNRGQSRYFEPSQITEAVNSAQLDMFNEGRNEFERTQSVNDLMRVFKKKDDISLTAGEGDLPSDYASLTGFDKQVDVIGDGRWGEAKADVVCPATSDYPKVNIYGTKIRVLPESLSSISINYLKKPTDSVYATTLSANGRDRIFDEGNSTDVEIPEQFKTDLLLKTCTYLGISLKDADLSQFEALKKQLEQ